MKHRTFFAARIQDRFIVYKNARLRKRGWQETIVPYVSYGTEDQLRILARVVLVPGAEVDKFRKKSEKFKYQRGWRNFFSHAVPFVTASVNIFSETFQVKTDRQGYIDVRIKNPGLSPGWHKLTLTTQSSQPTRANVLIVANEQTYGLISDIDDTIITTYLPRPLIAAWNSFVKTEDARNTVSGMAWMYKRFLKNHPGAPIIYVSTGAWNTVPFLTRFLKHYGFPMGPFLLTDWGPTNTGWFRSGIEHKRRSLRELARDFPKIKWLLVGDNGQHDPFLYNEFLELQPDRVRAIGIRELTPGEQVLAHGTTTSLGSERSLFWEKNSQPVVYAPDGFELDEKLTQALTEESTE